MKHPTSGMIVFRKRSCRRLVAWVAIAAMGLLMVLPTVSRSLEALSLVPAMDMSMSTHGGMNMSKVPDCPAHQAGERHHRTPEAPSTDACGYCSLMFHSPALAWATLPLLPALPSTPLRAHVIVPAAPTLLPLVRRSRGPPLA